MFSIPSFSAGFAVGFGTGFISRELVTTGTTIFRPVVKGTMKTAVALFQKGRGAVATLGESFEDLVAEVRSELNQTRRAPAEYTEETVVTTIEIEDEKPERATRSKERKKEQA